MSYVNVLFALKEINYQRLKDNFRADADGNRIRTDFTVSQALKLKDHYDGTWPPVTIASTQYRVIMFTFPEIPNDRGDISSGHKWVDFLVNNPDFSGAFILIGVWNMDGSQWGTTIVPAVRDEDGTEITPESIEGTPVYPLHPQHMLIMPDDVTYDQDGNETSRVPAAAPKDVCLVGGWEPRIW